MKKALLSLISLIILIVLYLFFWPVSINPESWTSPNDPGYTGVYAVNDLMSHVEVRHNPGCNSCEDVAVDEQGRVYGASVDGNIVRFDTPSSEATILVNTGGRPLGLDFDTLGNLYIADAMKGLLRLNTSGDLEVLSTEHNNRPYLFTDDLEVGSDGKVYFSDASDQNNIHAYVLDLLEHKPRGRLLVYDPSNNKVDLLLDKLYFANGVAVAADASFVLVNETASYKTTRYWLTGDKKGQHDVFIEALPAFNDGISRGEDDIFWIALISPRNPLVDGFSEKPFMRKMIARLPGFLQPAPEKHTGAIGVNSNGEVIYNFQSPKANFAQISSVQQWDNDLYFGSLGMQGVGVLKDFKRIAGHR